MCHDPHDLLWPTLPMWLMWPMFSDVIVMVTRLKSDTGRGETGERYSIRNSTNIIAAGTLWQGHCQHAFNNVVFYLSPSLNWHPMQKIKCRELSKIDKRLFIKAIRWIFLGFCFWNIASFYTEYFPRTGFIAACSNTESKGVLILIFGIFNHVSGIWIGLED